MRLHQALGYQIPNESKPNKEVEAVTYGGE
jgi:hypothetical protein